MQTRRSIRQDAPLPTGPAFALEFAPGRASDGDAGPLAPSHDVHDASSRPHGLYTADRQTGIPRPATADEVLDAARRILSRRVRRGTSIASPRATREFLRLQLASHDHEVFAILFLDNRHRLIEFVPLFRGTVDGASVHPREVVKEALARNAAVVILAHNHPSGVAEPSHADELITRRLRDALALVDIRILDHFVVTGDEIVSFAERGLL
jgi:DNA repair protein RadC